MRLYVEAININFDQNWCLLYGYYADSVDLVISVLPNPHKACKLCIEVAILT